MDLSVSGRFLGYCARITLSRILATRKEQPNNVSNMSSIDVGSSCKSEFLALLI